MRILTVALLLCAALAVSNLAFAQTCVNGAAGVAPAATLTFTAPTTNTDGTPIATPLTYNLYQSTSPGTEVKVASALKGSPIAVSSALAPATTFYFKVSAVDANGVEGVLSNEVCKVFPKSTPGTITITIS